MNPQDTKPSRNLLERFVDWVLAERTRPDSEHEAGQIRYFVAFTTAVIIWAPFYMAVYIAAGAPVGAIVIGAGLIAALLTLYLFRRGAPRGLAGRLLIIELLYVLLLLMLVTGGPLSPAMVWTVTVPLFALIVVGHRAGICWCVTVLTINAAIFIVHYWFWRFPNILTAQASYWILFAGITGVVLCNLSLAVLHERLRAEALRQVRQANEAKSAFLANVSHEIRTPMTAILGFADHLLEPGLSEHDRIEAIDIIRRNGQHLLQILNDILDLSKIEAGRLHIESLPVSPLHIVDDVLSLMRVRAALKNLDLLVDYATPIPRTIPTDPTRLRQILMNLIGNAIKFTDQGSVRITVRYTPPDNDQPSGYLSFDVTDTGPGIDPDQLQRLFQPFAQADISTSRRYGGTGLGLAISRRLAQMLGGDLTAQSQPGNGSTFRLTLPTGPLTDTDLIRPDNQPDDSEPPPTATDDLGPDALAGLRILLAEDGPDNQRLISLILRRCGAEVDIVENGRHAVEAALRAEADNRPFDVVLMDMQMPEMDGYGAASMLRDAGFARPVIALTAHAMQGDRERCLRAGCDDYATKPIDRAALIATIRRHVRRHRVPDAHTTGAPATSDS